MILIVENYFYCYCCCCYYILFYLMMYTTPKGSNKVRSMYIFIYAYQFGSFFLLAKYELFKVQWLSRNSTMKGILLQLVSTSVSSTLLFIVFLTTSFTKEIIALGSFLQEARLLLSVNLERAEVITYLAMSILN